MVILATFAVALLLTVMPLPDWARGFRPHWYTLVLIYWCVALPERVGVLSGWLLGVFVDVLTGTLLGEHALVLALVAFVGVTLHRRIRMMPRYQQMLMVFALLLLEKLLLLWIVAITSDSPAPPMYWSGALIGALLWPWVFVVMRDTRRRFKVA